MPKKLGIKPGARLCVVRAPDDFTTTLGPLPADVAIRSVDKASAAKGQRFDVIVLFVRELKDLKRDLPALRERLDPTGGLWIAWPKKASGIATDAGETNIRARGLATGLVDNKICAIDDVWSGLRFVVRLADRPKARRR